MPTSSSKLQSSLSKSNETQIVLRSAIASRLLLLTLIILWRSLFTPYDTSAILNPNCLISSNSNNTSKQNLLLPSIGSAIEGSIVWDGVYFVRIAQCGYEYEQTYAFLPLLPICLYVISNTVFAPLIPIIGYRSVLGLSGYVINNIAFVFAAVYFYRLSLLILKDSGAALRASLLFCFNPASIFYSSLYSESLYALFSLGGIYHLISGANTIAVLQLALSGSARSNGVLNAGYFCFQTMHKAYDAIFQKRHSGLAVQSLVAGAVRTLFIFIPFIVFQVYGYYNICHGRLLDEMSPWCKGRLPVLYDYLQSHYWGVGFLRYFQFKQLPNFLLASPILSLALLSIIHYAKLRPEVVFSLGFRAAWEEKKDAAVLYLLHTTRESNSLQFSDDFSSNTLQGNSTLKQRKKKTKEENSDSSRNPAPSNYEAKSGYSSILILPFVLHLGFMGATAFLVMHVQVATRFLSASPPLYWFSSYLMISPGNGRRWGYLIWTYSASYILLGSLLFSNFYPFT
ncbi:hypothetical protein AQUCO_01300449v1 [Aquilegia coerulea]|uniref:GPI mannosyltransferase 2 n=1 Tax=Aquilegia coerulea TaxID=218851 RepID=A0A2G5E1P8_AQUCA|nr:hypothetical protein AQUCO_01300449v1 [Aquilegia coerulea]PIA49692.1 hypothetical protein AQUCO_01300449v1 [Aquilegia coerulea]PIA49693.1 hypothetical protein AQUCO_01300449v1 [Aquilegia coerulea]